MSGNILIDKLRYACYNIRYMSTNKRPSQGKPTEADIGAAMMDWYSDAIVQYPEGLVTQAQAAKMLGVSRVAAGRLVSRGYLRAVYFPKPPDIAGITVGGDDPTWLKILGKLSIALGDAHTYGFPQACYVSFGDVLELWENGSAKDKCKRDWNEIMAVAVRVPTKRGEHKSFEKLRDIHQTRQRIATQEREKRNA